MQSSAAVSEAPATLRQSSSKKKKDSKSKSGKKAASSGTDSKVNCQPPMMKCHVGLFGACEAVMGTLYGLHSNL